MLSPQTNPAVKHLEGWARRFALAHALFYIATGLWPVLHMPSFIAVTGPKVDLWLVQTVGLLIAVIGLAIGVAGWFRRLTPETLALAIGAPLALAGIDLFYVMAGRIPPIYLLDAIVELGLVAGWIIVCLSRNQRH